MKQRAGQSTGLPEVGPIIRNHHKKGGQENARCSNNMHGEDILNILVKDNRHYFSIEAQQGMEQASYEGSQVDWIGQPGTKTDAV